MAVGPYQSFKQRVPNPGVAGQRLAVEHEAFFGGGGHADVAAELLRRARLALGDTGQIRLVQSVVLRPVSGFGVKRPYREPHLFANGGLDGRFPGTHASESVRVRFDAGFTGKPRGRVA